MPHRTLNDALKQVVVIGAAGKMGRGIALLLLQEMARFEAETTGNVGSGTYQLFLIDQDEEGLKVLKHDLHHQLTRYAEKNINALRLYYRENPTHVSNEEIIRAFVEGGLETVETSSDFQKARRAHLVFEAIAEDIEAKCALFSSLKAICSSDTFYLTNTSSIPITLLDEKCCLNNQIIGFHFYNPPVMQKLVELIPLKNNNPQLIILAEELAKRLSKTIVYSNDVAGFIGNGYFLRTVRYACQKARELASDRPLFQAIYLLNVVTQNFLLRPMGIFQLIDYVGVDVVKKIAKIMSDHLPEENFEEALVSNAVAQRVLGGQDPHGKQKNGFLKYDKGIPVAVYDWEQKSYRPFSEGSWVKECEEWLGNPPDQECSWKRLHRDPNKKEKIDKYFETLRQEVSHGAEIAQECLAKEYEIANQLVSTGVAKDLKDVTTVLQTGFNVEWHDKSPNLELAR